MRDAPLIPDCIDLQPIDEAARDGGFRLVFGGTIFALVRWTKAQGWVFSSGVPLEFAPTHYHAVRS